MKKLYLILLVIPFLLSAKNETVWVDEFIEVYQQANYKNFGHSYVRDQIVKFDIYKFAEGVPKSINNGKGYITSLTVNTTLKAELDTLLENNISIYIKGRHLKKIDTDEGRLYIYQENERGIYIAFMLEKATNDILNSIAKFYNNEPAVLQEVYDYYANNYVIKVLRANNAYSHKEEPTIIDIMLNATMIADRNQLFWGVHDGLNFLGDLKKYYDEQLHFDILNNNYEKKIKP